MRSALALTLVAAMVGGCFPHSPKKRMIAEIIEGALVAGGVGLEATVTTTADCQANLDATASCSATGQRNGAIGVAMILTGIVAFIATISSASDDTASPLKTMTPAAAPQKTGFQLPHALAPAPSLVPAGPAAGRFVLF